MIRGDKQYGPGDPVHDRDGKSQLITSRVHWIAGVVARGERSGTANRGQPWSSMRHVTRPLFDLEELHRTPKHTSFLHPSFGRVKAR
jgi:hypothetical protein